MSVITPAASVLLSRGSGSREIYAILRSPGLKFFGGFWAFPGGKLNRVEAEFPDPIAMRRLAACRELFEETGILVARRPNGTFPTLDETFTRARAEILAERLPFDDFLRDQDLTISDRDFARIGEITTPAFAPIRFATTFFVAHLPPNQVPDVWPGELEQGEWIDVGEMHARWRRGERLLTPPSAMSLEHLGDEPVESAPTRLGPLFDRLAAGAEHPIYLAPCVRMLPCRTAALPPSTHTNAYLVGNGPRYLIDPGPEDADEQRRLFAILDEHAALGQRIDGVLLTHHHRDHVGAANACAERYRVPVFAHPQTAEHLRNRVRVDRFIGEGDRIDLGPSPADGGPWFLTTLHAPGHASGHVVFLDSCYRLLFVGDMISTATTMVIAPPDGDLAEYLRSLRRLRSVPARVLLCAHGNVSAQPEETIDAALDHRARRETQLLTALGDGVTSIPDLTQRLYRGLPEPLMRFASAQVHAGLLKLKNEGQADSNDQQWYLLPASRRAETSTATSNVQKPEEPHHGK